MSKLKNNEQGFLITILIIVILFTLGYVAWNNFLRSDTGQEIQNTTNKVIETIETATEGATQKGSLIDKVTQ